MAVATRGDGGLDDRISDAFGRAEKITLIDFEDGKISRVKVMDNPSVDYRFGAGPILVKTLVDMGVDVAVGPEFGLGTAELMKDHGIRMVLVRPDMPVREAIRSAEGGETSS